MDGIVIVGAGLGGLRSAETLRREGYEGRITLVGAETALPYDRPPLSKEVLTGTRAPETTALISEEGLEALELELALGTSAHDLDLTARTIGIGANTLAFEGLMLAPGAAPRTLPVLAELEDVLSLRTLGDALRLRNALAEARHLVIVGAGFIGSEVASSARERGLDVTIIELERAPLARAFGPAASAALVELHRLNGTQLHLGVTITRAEQTSSTRLWLSNGEVLEADVVLQAVGVAPAVDWLASSGLALDNGIVCDASLNAGGPGIYGLGDAASWPNELFGERMRVEHWTNANEQARHAARNLLHGTDTPFRGSNFVWSDQYGKRIQFAGSTRSDEVVVIDGSIAGGEFVAWYRAGDRLVGALAVDSPRLLMRSKALIEREANWANALASVAADE